MLLLVSEVPLHHLSRGLSLRAASGFHVKDAAWSQRPLSLRDPHLTRAHISHAIHGCDLNGCDIKGCDIDGCLWREEFVMPGDICVSDRIYTIAWFASLRALVSKISVHESNTGVSRS